MWCLLATGNYQIYLILQYTQIKKYNSMSEQNAVFCVSYHSLAPIHLFETQCKTLIIFIGLHSNKWAAEIR